MKRSIIGFELCVAIIFFSGVFIPISAQSISGSLGNGTVKRGESARGTVVISIPGGLHVNSNRPSSPYAIATTVRVSAPGVTVRGVNYPRGHNRKFAFSENEINVYEGRTPITFKISVPETFRGNVVRIRAVVRYQACTEEVCYPPKNKEITLTARVI